MKMSKFFRKKLRFFLLILFVGILIEIAFLAKISSHSSSSVKADETKLRSLAQGVMNKCSSKGFPPSCYDDEIPNLMDPPTNLSMEDAFNVTRFVQEKDNRYLYCHVLAHKVAEKETKKNIDNWKDVITRCPNTMCNNGCSHGALMERFKNDSLTDAQIEKVKPELPDVCEPRGNWHPRGIEISMCYHAMGHLNMYMTNANIPKSLELCNFIGKKSDGRNYVQTCTEGVFMQVFQPLEPEDYALIRNIVPKKDETDKFCAPYKDGPVEAFDACHREAWAFHRKEIETPEGLTKFCSYSDDFLAQKKCYSSLMNIITVDYLVDKKDDAGLMNFCTHLSKEWISECFSNAARRLMQIDPLFYADKAVDVCKQASKINEGEACYQLLAFNSKESFQPNSPEFTNYCNKLPGTWKDKCLNLN